MDILEQPPSSGSFVSLIEHQSTTPASFHTGPPVLHYYSDRCKVIVLESELSSAPALSNLVRKASQPAHSNEQPTDAETNGSHAAQKTLEDIDVWVTSDKLLVYSRSAQTGLSIAYPTIAIHAIQSDPAPSSGELSSQSLYMQLMPTLPSESNDEDDEPPDTVSLTIIPTASAAPTRVPEDADDAVQTEDEPQLVPVEALYKALSDCSDLHPDPVDEDDEEGVSRLIQAGLAIPGMSDGSLPPAMPGSGGWITAENMHEFIDQDGNWIGGNDDAQEDGDGELGPGAGTVRPRADGEEEGSATGDDTKWQRTS